MSPTYLDLYVSMAFAFALGYAVRALKPGFDRELTPREFEGYGRDANGLPVTGIEAKKRAGWGRHE